MNEELITPRVIKDLHHIARKRGRSWGIEDELFSVAETAVMLKVHKFDPSKGCNFRSWAYTVAGFAISDFLRAQDLMSRRARTAIKSGNGAHLKRRVRVGDDVLAYKHADIPPVYDGPAIQPLLAQLDSIAAFAVWQYYFGGRRLQDIGAFLDLTEARMVQIIKAALPQLRQIFNKAI